MSVLLEKILDDANLQTAMEKVISNGGSFGVDKVRTDELKAYFEEHQATINLVTYRLEQLEKKQDLHRRSSLYAPDLGCALYVILSRAKALFAWTR